MINTFLFSVNTNLAQAFKVSTATHGRTFMILLAVMAPGHVTDIYTLSQDLSDMAPRGRVSSKQ